MIKLTWDDLIIRKAPAEPAAIFESWQWVLSGRFRPIAWSKFGDSFIERETGTVELLSVVGGVLRTIAQDEDEFYELLNEQEHQEDWLLSLLVYELHHVPMIPAAGQCYGLRLHPVLGGRVEATNVVVMPFAAWATVSGQFYEQARPTRLGAVATQDDSPS